MHACRPALAAALAAVSLASCGSDEPPPFKTVSQPATTSTSSPTTTLEIGSDLPVTDLLSKVRAGTRAKLGGLVEAQATLEKHGREVAEAAASVQQIVDKLGTGNAAPGGSAPEVTELGQALASFGDALRPMADPLLPQLSTELQTRARQLDSSRPAIAAKLLAAKGEVDGAIGGLPRLQRQIDEARLVVREQRLQESLDADRLHEAVTTGGENTTAALGSIGAALSGGLTALGSAS